MEGGTQKSGYSKITTHKFMSIHLIPVRARNTCLSWIALLLECSGCFNGLFYRNHMTILTLNAILGINGVFPFIVGPFDVEVGYWMEDMMAVGTKLRFGMEF